MADSTGPTISVVVVVYDMARELPRTLASLAPGRQSGIDAADLEVIVVDNGSPTPVDPSLAQSFPGELRVIRIDPAPPSPAHAANTGVAAATGDLVGLIVDGARIASPGLLEGARRAAGLAERSVVTAPAYHLGAVAHMKAAESGHDQAAEDALLASVGWEDDGYELFRISALAGSSSRGWFGPMGESSSLFMPPGLWKELGGLDERFDLPGGGLVNHDLYNRACALPGSELVVLLGEGTFHQFHGGAATSRRFSWEEMAAQYAEIVGRDHRPPDREPLYLGTVPPAALGHLRTSLEKAEEHAARASRTPSDSA